jgi:hypothetical protein
MTVVSGQVTFGSAGTKNVGLGVNVNDLDVYCGARSGTTETFGTIAVGHADSANQFCFTSTNSKSTYDTSNVMVVYNSSGTKVLEFSVTGGWGTSTITFNCTVASSSYPFQLVGR